MKRFISLLLTFLALNSYAFDYQSYRATPLVEALKEHQEDHEEKADIIINGSVSKYSSNVIFTKKLRKIGEPRKGYIRSWAKSLGISREVADLYQHEFLVTDGKIEIWVPMQEPVLPHMGKELTTDFPFILYYIYAGKQQDEIILLGTEFQAK